MALVQETANHRNSSIWNREGRANKSAEAARARENVGGEAIDLCRSTEEDRSD